MAVVLNLRRTLVRLETLLGFYSEYFDELFRVGAKQDKEKLGALYFVINCIDAINNAK